MAHLSYASPDRKWALVVEMDPVWQPCRMIPMDGRSVGRQAGPKGKCTAAAWSPDGKWMYFGAEVEGTITFGGSVFRRENRSSSRPVPWRRRVWLCAGRPVLITSLGMRQARSGFAMIEASAPFLRKVYPTISQSGPLWGSPAHFRGMASRSFISGAIP